MTEEWEIAELRGIRGRIEGDPLDAVLESKAEWERAKESFSPVWMRNAGTAYYGALDTFWSAVQDKARAALMEDL